MNIEKLEQHLDDIRSNLPDSILLMRYEIILRQQKDGIDREETLVKYINELEFRGINYGRISRINHC